MFRSEKLEQAKAAKQTILMEGLVFSLFSLDLLLISTLSCLPPYSWKILLFTLSFCSCGLQPDRGSTLRSTREQVV